MTPPVKLLLIFVDETDCWGESPLYEAIVKRLRQLGVAGATVTTGTMGFGSHLSVHKKGLFGVPDDRPVVISAADNEQRIRAAIPEIKSMVQEGLILLLDAEFLGPEMPS